MNSRSPNLSHWIMMAVLVLILGSPSYGATWNKTATGTYNWNDNANWSTPATFPNAPGAVATMNVNLAGGQTINLNQTITVGTLTFGSGGANGYPMTINAGTAGSLIFDNNGSTAILNFDSGTTAGANSIGANITLNDNLTISTVDSVNGNLTITGSITSSANESLFLRGARPITLSGTINLGAGALTTTDGGTRTINSTGNTWGGTQIAVGTLVLGANNALPPPPLYGWGKTSPT